MIDGGDLTIGHNSASETVQPIKYENERTHGLSFRNTLALVKDNISRSAFLNLAFVAILIAAFTLISSFFSLFQYNKRNAYVSTLKANDQYTMAITKYVDEPYEVTSSDGTTTIQHGAQIYYEGISEDDMAELEEKLAGRGTIYPSYFFTKNFQDFTDTKIYTYSSDFQTVAYSFCGLIAVEDFSTFNTPVQYGSLPNLGDEVLIYDYMADCLITHGVLQGDNIWDVVDQTLTDKQTGFSMKISGILKSNYIDYYGAASENENISIDFIETYLSSLQVVFMSPTLAKSLEQESKYSSIYDCTIIAKEDLTKVDSSCITTTYKKCKYTETDDFNFIYTSENYGVDGGVILSVNEVANILDIAPQEVTVEVAQDFADKYYFNCIEPYNDYSLEAGGTLLVAYTVMGIYDNATGEDGVLYQHIVNEDDHYLNGTLRRFYVGLNKNWKINEEIFDLFWVEDKPQSFYAANPDYYEEGYYEYMPFGVLIKDADYYLVNVKNMAGIVMYVLVAFAIVSVVAYSIINIKKFEFKTGVLKAMGAKNSTIVFTFVTQLLLVSIIAFAVSIPLSYIVLSSINGKFVQDLSSWLVFFSIKVGAIALSFAFATIGVLLAAVLPLIRLYFAAPASIIKTGRSNL